MKRAREMVCFHWKPILNISDVFTKKKKTTQLVCDMERAGYYPCIKLPAYISSTLMISCSASIADEEFPLKSPENHFLHHYSPYFTIYTSAIVRVYDFHTCSCQQFSSMRKEAIWGFLFPLLEGHMQMQEKPCVRVSSN